MIESLPGAVKRRVGSALTRAGAIIGTLGAVAMLIKLKVVIGPGVQQLPYQGLFAASAVLIVLGAMYGRQGRNEEEEAKATSSRPSDSLPTSSRDGGALPEPYSTSEPLIRERRYERTDRESQ